MRPAEVWPLTTVADTAPVPPGGGTFAILTLMPRFATGEVSPPPGAAPRWSPLSLTSVAILSILLSVAWVSVAPRPSGLPHTPHGGAPLCQGLHDEGRPKPP